MAKVMLIEDDATMIGLLKTLLGIDGYEVVAFEGGEDVLQAVRRERPDLILLDINLKNFGINDISGFDLLMGMRSDDDLKHIGVIKEVWDKIATNGTQMGFMRMQNGDVISKVGSYPSEYQKGVKVEYDYVTKGKWKNLKTIEVYIDKDAGAKQEKPAEQSKISATQGDKPEQPAPVEAPRVDTILDKKLTLMGECKKEIEKLYGMDTKEHPELIEAQVALFKSIQWGNLK